MKPTSNLPVPTKSRMFTHANLKITLDKSIFSEYQATCMTCRKKIPGSIPRLMQPTLAALPLRRSKVRLAALGLSRSSRIWVSCLLPPLRPCLFGHPRCLFGTLQRPMSPGSKPNCPKKRTGSPSPGLPCERWGRTMSLICQVTTHLVQTSQNWNGLKWLEELEPRLP